MPLRSGDATLHFDSQDAVLRAVELIGADRPLQFGSEPLFDLAMPLPHNLPHRLRPSGRGPNSYAMTSDEGTFPVTARLDVRTIEPAGFSIRLTVENHSAYIIPQVLFPRIHGLQPTGLPAAEVLHLGRSMKWPYLGMQSPDDAATFLDLHRRWYFVYGMQEWNLKWFRLGNAARGLAVYSLDTAAPLQGLYVEKDAGADRLAINWAHYPHIAPGATWQSPEIILLPHNGDWRVGAEPYKNHTARTLPTVRTTNYLHNSLGVRSVFFSTYLYDRDPNFTYRDLPVIARDALDHGIRELNVWFAFDAYFELPMKLNPKLGTADDLKSALARCRKLGVNVSAFVSCRSVKSSSAPANWFEVDERGNRRTQNFSYSLGFVPPFNPPYCNRDESAFVCPAVTGYRDAFVNACRDLHALGFSSVSYDQLFADRLCYGKDHGHAPQDLAPALYDLVRSVHREGQRVDPEASLSGEFFNDVSQTFQHYNWDWISGTLSLEDHEVFRFVFPRYRLGVLVDRSRRWLLEGFCRGLLINFLPDGAEGTIARDEAFSALAKKLATARKTYARFFEQGEYFGTEEVANAPGLLSSSFSNGSESLLIVANISGIPVDVPTQTHVVATNHAAPPVKLPPYGFAFFLLPKGAETWTSA